MITFYANGVKVIFPFKPYDIQSEYIEKVITAIKSKQNAILESPTGTGKTLSLLCSSLAWLESGTGQKPMIYYTSRTHMQLAQAAKEMKRTAYARIPSVVIGSRNQMCLNSEVKHQAGDHLINRACRNAIAKNACSYHMDYEKKLEHLDTNNVHDIEDLCNYGRAKECCPYYAAKKLAESKASVVFMPYNYLLDSTLRKSAQLKLENSVIIFDEAHNIESTLKDSVSGKFSQSCLRTIQDSCLKLPAKINDALNQEKHGLSRTGYDPKPKHQPSIVDEFAKPKSNHKKDKEPKSNPIEELAEKLTNDKLRQVKECAEHLLSCQALIKIVDGKFINTDVSIDALFEKFRQSGINFATSDLIRTTLDSMASFWSIAGVMSPALVAKYVTAISNLSRVVTLLFPENCSSLKSHEAHHSIMNRCYAVHIEGKFDQGTFVKKSTLVDWKLNLWCLNPAIGWQKVLDTSCVFGPRSLIITSGTLAPIDPMVVELGIKVSIAREFKHLIDETQLKVMIVGQSASRFPLQSDFKSIQNPLYASELGKTLLQIFRMLPFGTLIFFPSYSLMNKVYEFWEKRSTIWRDICKITSVFRESKASSFDSDVIAYKRLIDGGSKSVFMGVCRGKLSEGVSLDGNYCRSVIMIGLPFPNLTDPHVIATRKYQDKINPDNYWYSCQMKRALNQAFGRVIRNRTDFGMLILCDPRFKLYRYGVSKWIQPFFPENTTDDLKAINTTIRDFFGQHDIDIEETNIVSSSQSDAGAFEIVRNLKQYNYDQSPFTDSAKNSQSSSKSSQSRISSSPLSSSNRSAEARQAAMLAEYTVDRSTFNRIKQSRLPPVIEIESEASSSKRPRTKIDVIDTLFSGSNSQELGDSIPSKIKPTNSSQPLSNEPSQASSIDEAVYRPKPAKSLNIFKKKKPKQQQQQQRPRDSGPMETQLNRLVVDLTDQE